MKRSVGIRLCIGVAVIAWIVPFLILPSLGSGNYLSPDETAVVVASSALLERGSMRIPDDLTESFPWLHPRSFVTASGSIVPVGFLGMPLIFGLLRGLLGDFALAAFPFLLAISVVIPLVQFTRNWKPGSRLVVLSVWLSFPTVILYANRGTFPNLNALCLTIWAVYLVWSKRSLLRSLSAGLIFGLALAIRPIELFWMLPWLWLAWRSRLDAKRKKEGLQLLGIGIGVYLVVMAYLILSYRTYGNPFAIGYWLRDPIIDGLSGISQPVAPVSTWPFGFHPTNVFFNVSRYFGLYLAPWGLLTLLSGIVAWKNRTLRPYLFVGLWTIVSLVLVYGQAIYQDHVGFNVTSTGNSFLRYLLPLSCIAALSIGALFEWLSTRINRSHWKTLVVLTGTVLYIFGTWTALKRDDEGLLKVASDLKGYSDIRAQAVKKLAPDTIILSERSDKIFFPKFRAVSPLPLPEEISRLSAEYPVALYTREIDMDTLMEYAMANIALELVHEGERESLYLVNTVWSD